jgi:hypothetical protein
MVISGHVHQSPFIPDGSWYDRLGDTGDDGIALDDLEPAFDQDVEMTCRAAFVDDGRSRGEISLNSTGAIVENRAHSNSSIARARLGIGIAVVERIIKAGLPKLSASTETAGARVQATAFRLRCGS